MLNFDMFLRYKFGINIIFVLQLTINLVKMQSIARLKVN